MADLAVNVKLGKRLYEAMLQEHGATFANWRWEMTSNFE
jgi:hypothetical protein